jgi:hypothetical protein
VVSDERDLACANARTLLTHVTDGRTDRHCSVTHCDDSCHVIKERKQVDPLLNSTRRAAVTNPVENTTYLRIY